MRGAAPTPSPPRPTAAELSASKRTGWRLIPSRHLPVRRSTASSRHRRYERDTSPQTGSSQVDKAGR